MNIDPMARGVRQGRRFEDLCRELLSDAGFDDISGPFKVVDLGCEIDIGATNLRGFRMWFDCKGSWSGARPGLRRTDTVKKAITTGFLTQTGHYPPVVILTSHLPVENSHGHRMLQAAIDCCAIYDVVCIDNPGHLERLAKIDDRGQP